MQQWPGGPEVPSLQFALELELIQSHMAQKPVLRGEVGCVCVAREVSVERRGMGERHLPSCLYQLVRVPVCWSWWPHSDCRSRCCFFESV